MRAWNLIFETWKFILTKARFRSYLSKPPSTNVA